MTDLTRAQLHARTRGRHVRPIAMFVAVLAAVAGFATLIAAAVLTLHGKGETPSATQTVTSSPAPAPTPNRSRLPSAEPTTAAPAGIVLLTDPAWVARVSEASGIPARALSAYAGADLSVREHEGCAVGWNTLAGIGLVETEHGTIHGGSIDPDGDARPTIIGIPLDGTASATIRDTDDGLIDGDATWDRAVGPLQFIPETWEQWGSDGNDDGVADINKIDDAALTAARYLCHAYGTLHGQDAWIGAIRSYNDNPDYQSRVADAASYYATFTDQ